jgi:hypothetical protein
MSDAANQPCLSFRPKGEIFQLLEGTFAKQKNISRYARNDNITSTFLALWSDRD